MNMRMAQAGMHVPTTHGPSTGGQSYWVRNKDEDVSPRVRHASARILGLGIFILGLVILSVGLIIGLEFPSFVSGKITKDQCILNKDHMFYDKWRNDKSWSRYNRVYYWAIQNADAFLAGASPKFVERGPYVYKETRSLVNVHFSVTRMSYQTRVTQTFSEAATNNECGGHCSQFDKLTMINTNLLHRLHVHGGWDGYVYSHVAPFVSIRLRRLRSTHDNVRDIYSYIGCFNANCDQTYATLTRIPADAIANISFGAFVRTNNTADKRALLQSVTNDVSKRLIVLSSIYDKLPKFGVSPLHSNKACSADIDTTFKYYYKLQLTNSDISTLPQTLRERFNGSTGTEFSYTRVNLTGSCSVVAANLVLNAHLTRFAEWPELQWTLSACDTDKDVCDQISGSYTVLLAYLNVVNEFVQSYLINSVLNTVISDSDNSLVQTISQSKLSLGYHRPSRVWETRNATYSAGTLTHHTGVIDALRRSYKTVIATCLDKGNAGGNMAVTEYMRRPLATPRNSGNLIGYSDVFPPSTSYRACSSSCPDQPSYDVFVEDLNSSLKFDTPEEVNAYDNRLIKFRLSRDAFPLDAPCQQLNTTLLTGYPSWTGAPYFAGANCGDMDRLLTAPSRGDVTSSLLMEPWTGRIWKKVIKLQTSTEILPEFLGRELLSPLSRVRYTAQPIPVHWVDRRMDIVPSEVEYFEKKIARLMTLSCGGIISLTMLAIITFGISVFVGLFSKRKNKVEPLKQPKRSYGVNTEVG